MFWSFLHGSSTVSNWSCIFLRILKHGCETMCSTNTNSSTASQKKYYYHDCPQGMSEFQQLNFNSSIEWVLDFFWQIEVRVFCNHWLDKNIYNHLSFCKRGSKQTSFHSSFSFTKILCPKFPLKTSSNVSYCPSISILDVEILYELNQTTI